MATRTRRRRRSTSGTHHRRRRRTSNMVIMGATTRRRRRTPVYHAKTRTHRRRNRRGMGALSLSRGGIPFKDIGILAVGIAGGAILTHMALRPLEQKITAREPMLAKAMGFAEILLGGFIGLKAKGALVKGAGFGIMAAGVHTAMKQFNLHKESPAISGPGDGYTGIRVPISGAAEANMNQWLSTNRLQRTSFVAGAIAGTTMGEMGASSSELYRTNLVAGADTMPAPVASGDDNFGYDPGDYLYAKGYDF